MQYLLFTADDLENTLYLYMLGLWVVNDLYTIKPSYYIISIYINYDSNLRVLHKQFFQNDVNKQTLLNFHKTSVTSHKNKNSLHDKKQQPNYRANNQS